MLFYSPFLYILIHVLTLLLYLSCQEYHLAKRYYDLATETSTEALVPANIALLKLNAVHYFLVFKEVQSGFCCVLVTSCNVFYFPLAGATFC